MQGLENRRVAEEERLVQEEQDQLDEEERLRVEAEEVRELWSMFRGLLLCYVVVVFHTEWCIRKP